MGNKIGQQTLRFKNPPTIFAVASIVGKKEGEGPLNKFFDEMLDETGVVEDSWEKGESLYVKKAVDLVIKKGGIEPSDVDFAFSGDLLNQCSASTFGFRDFDIPFFGIFGACSTFGEALCLGAITIDGGFAKKVICGAGSHFCSAEKQFRFPLGLGTQRPLSSTWTVTGNGQVLMTKEGAGPKITHCTVGKIIDFEISDASNMGATMAPAAASTIAQHFADTGRTPDDYDVIATGDLGYIGRALLRKLLMDEGFVIGDNLTDCGVEIFDREKQDTHSGGSGCGCSAVTFCGYYHSLLECGEIKKMLLVPTGALLSTFSAQQGETIPAIAHAISIEMR